MAAALVACAAMTNATGVAQAAPIQIGTGGTPHVVGAPDGTLHLVWTRDDNEGHRSYVHYCRIDPGQSSCAVEKEFDWGASPSFPQADIIREPGAQGDSKIDIVVYADAGAYLGTTLIQSTANEAAGNTWQAPKNIGPTDSNFYPSASPQSVTFGPGAYQFGWVSDTAQVDVQYASTTGPVSRVRLDNLMTGGPFQRMGLLDSSTAIVVRRDFDGANGAKEFAWRLSPADGNPRNAANWQPEHSVGGISSTLEFSANGVSAPVVASVEKGPKAATDETVQIRRISSDGQTISAPVQASDIDYIDGIYTTLDPSSNVHVVFIAESGGTHDIDYLASPTGATWPAKPIVLSHETPSGPVVIGATADGNGAAFWRRAQGLGNDDDQIVMTRVQGPASAFPPPDAPPPVNPPVDPACVKTVSAGIAQFLSGGCFRASSGNAKLLTTTDPFRVNGVLVTPGGKTVTLDTATNKLTMPSGVARALPPINLGTTAETWTFPTGKTYNPGTFDFDKAGLGGTLLKLALAGDGKLVFSQGKVTLKTNLRLPAPFETYSGGVDLVADNFSAIKLDGLHVSAKELPFGFHDLELDYIADPPTFTGTLHWRQEAIGGDDYDATIRIVNGTLEFVKVAGTFGAPGKKIYPPFVFMRYLGLSLKTKPNLVLGGQTIITAGPSFGDTSVLSIGRPFDDYGTVDLTLTWPFKLDAFAPVYILGYKLGSGELHYTFPGKVSFKANASLGNCSIVGAKMQLSGFVNAANPPQFNAEGKATACLAGASVSVDGVLSSKGVAACGEFGFGKFSVSAGAGHFWSGGTELKLVKCSTEKYKVAGRRQAGGARTFQVGAGLKQLNVEVTGDSGPPLVTVAGPNGVSYTAGATVTKGDNFIAVPDAASKTQTLLIPNPAPGTYTVTPGAGSPNITGLELDRPVAAPTVKGTVRKLGARRELRYSVTNLDGRRVEFFEEGSGEFRALGTAKGATGTLRWVPKTLTGGTRQVTAVVSQGETPLSKRTLATYVLPKPRPAGRARALKATHRAGRLVLTWKPGANAKRQELTVLLGNGLRTFYRVSGRTRTLTVPSVAAKETGTVTVTAIRADGRPGAKATLKVKPAPKKKAPKKKRK